MRSGENNDLYIIYTQINYDTRIIPGMGHRHIFDIKCPKNVHQILILMSHYCPINLSVIYVVLG